MWDWYNRPGGIKRVPTWKIVLIMIGSAVISTVLIWILFSFLAPVLFTRVPT